MKYLYVDNLRGFEDTYIPIKKVNFLVGENSTGKTSILSLIRLLGSPDFWFRQILNTNEIQMGDYYDIVSVSANDRSYFKIGVIEAFDAAEDGDDTSVHLEGFLMTFAEQDGLPLVRQYNYLAGREQVQARFSDRVIQYKILDFDASAENAEFLFKTWLSESEIWKGYKTLRLADLPFSRRRALPYLDSLVGAQSPPGDREGYSAVLRLPEFAFRLSWFAPIRSKPKRTYDSYQVDPTPEGDHTPYVIKRLLEKRTTSKRFLESVEKIGKESGLFESVQVKRFGTDLTAPFELDVVIGGQVLRTINVGYGVSQVLPIIVDLIAGRQGSWYAVQQPEIHLHPKAQAAFGDFIYELAANENKGFFIETHSDYMIDRFRLNCRNRLESISAQVLFFERTEKGNEVHSIDILDDGKYPSDQPKSFREFFINEEMSLLSL